jgi:hypothetical protein
MAEARIEADLAAELLSRLNGEYMLAPVYRGVTDGWEPYEVHYFEGPFPERERRVRVHFREKIFAAAKPEGAPIPLDWLFEQAGIDADASFVRGWLAGARLPYDRK